MATIIDELVTRFSLKDDVTAKGGRIAASAARIGQSISGAGDMMAGVARRVPIVGEAFGGMVTAATGAMTGIVGAITGSVPTILAGLSQIARGVVETITGLITAGLTLGTIAAGGLLAFGIAAMRTSADLEALKLGLAAVLGPAADLKAEIAKLAQVAKLPGLGFKEALQGATALIAAGFSADQARVALLAFGNALATVGKGKAELDGVVFALVQIANKTAISAEEINQMAERLPQLRAAIKAAFGTSVIEDIVKSGVGPKEFIARMTREFAKLPQVAGGAKNAFENLGDALTLALGKVGDVLNRTLLPSVDTFVTQLMAFIDSGKLEKIVQDVMNLIGTPEDIASGIQNAFEGVVGFLEEMPAMIKSVGDEIGNLVKEIKELKQSVGGPADWFWDFFGNIGDFLVDLLRNIPGLHDRLPNRPYGSTQDELRRQREEEEEAAKPFPGQENRPRRSGAGKGAAGIVGGAVSGAGSLVADTDKAFAEAMNESDVQRQIAQNTKQTAQNTTPLLDLVKVALGGGRHGAYGVAATELTGMKRGSGGGRGGGDRFDKIAQMLRGASMDAAYDLAIDMARGR